MNSAYKERNAKGFESDHFIEEEIKQLCLKHNINLIFELGSQFGATANRLSQFANVIGCEIDKETFEEAEKNLASRVLLFNCSSEMLLETNLKNVKGRNLLIYIDSHTWNQPTPILKELALIAESGIKPVVVIHDFLVPNRPELGFDSYEGQDYTFEWIQPHIERIYGKDYKISYNDKAAGAMRGVLYVEPLTFVERLEEAAEVIEESTTTKQDVKVKKTRKPMTQETKDKIRKAQKKK